MNQVFLLNDPGFTGNAADGMSCFHACIQMVMRTRPGGKVFSFEEIDEILHRKPGYYSWEYAICDALRKEGFEIKSISAFSTQRFVDEGESYLLEYFGPKAGKDQIDKSDILTVREDAKKFLANSDVIVEQRVPILENIRDDVINGWYVIPLVNSKMLNARDGYSGHFVFIYGLDNTNVFLHDPGPPPKPEREISWDVFEKAWSLPNENARSMICFRSMEHQRVALNA